jgi:hypothetical protein
MGFIAPILVAIFHSLRSFQANLRFVQKCPPGIFIEPTVQSLSRPHARVHTHPLPTNDLPLAHESTKAVPVTSSSPPLTAILLNPFLGNRARQARESYAKVRRTERVRREMM